ncbi:MAG TPA: ABC transporter substrate-binding protein, partial [Myxococcales bacterium]|nr:ABC transporter substrate-binding protein [Myxococcales bacterium]
MALSGNLSETSFTDLIQFYSISRQTAAVRIVSPAGPEHDGILYIEGGDVVDARFGELHGIEAVRRALRLTEGEFRVELNVRAEERTIFEPWSKLVLEELVSSDEALSLAAASGEHEEVLADLEEPALLATGGGRRADALVEEMSMLPSENKEGPRYCPVCNRRYLRGTSCSEDGAQLVLGTPPNGAATPRGLPRTLPPPPMSEPPKSRTGLYAGLVASILVVVGVAVVYVMRQRQQEDQAAQLEAARVATLKASEVQKQQISAARPQGVTDTDVTVGMSAPFSGPAKELGRGMKTGIDIAFEAANEAGGINGRKLHLVALDDGYEPERTKTVMRELYDQRKVFAFIGNVGTPTAEVSVPFALDKKALFFGPFTGAGLLRRDPPDRYVFNYRASYAEETAAAMKYLVDVKRIPPEQIAVFAQQDGYGDAGFNGVAKMLRKYGRDPDKALRVGYKRNTSDVQDAVDGILKSKQKIRAVIMVPTYKAAAKFIDKVKAERSDMLFMSVSFVGTQALADELAGYGPKVAEGVMVTQVVPLPTSKSTAVLKYQALLPKYSVGEKPDFVSLEGYLAAQLFIEGLKRAGREFTTESLVDSFEAMKGVDLGVGAAMNFGMSEHQASHKVWGTIIDGNGQFQNLEL